MTKKAQIGKLGENIASRFLEKSGFKIIERNYWKPQGEIDIVAEKGNTIHFVEVKTVSWSFSKSAEESRAIRPEENMHRNKIARLFRAIQIYLMERKISENQTWQLDAVFVYVDLQSKKSKIEYFEHLSL